METLTHRPEPHAWTCERCNGLIRFWDPNLRPDEDDPDTPVLVALRPRLCPGCVLDLTPPDRHERVLLRLRQGWQEWNLLGLSGEATLLAFELHVDDGPVYFFGVGVDEWSRASPFALDWAAPGCPAKFVVLVAFVSIGWAIGPKWLIRWSWDTPETPATYRYLDGTTPPTQVQWDQLSQALGRFHTLVISPGRPRGGTLYTSAQLEVMVPHERSAFLERHGRPPYDSELAALIGISEATFKRYKGRGMIPSS